MSRVPRSAIISEVALRNMATHYPTVNDDIVDLLNYIVRTNGSLVEFCFNVFANQLVGVEICEPLDGMCSDPFYEYVEGVMSVENVIHCSETMILSNADYGLDIEGVMSFLNIPIISEEFQIKLMNYLDTFLMGALNQILPIHNLSGTSYVCFILLEGYMMAISTV